jgi:hypothetical protein
MSASPETKRGNLSIQELPEEFSSEIPVGIENKSVPSSMTAIPTNAQPLYNDNGQALVETPQTEVITITIPKPKEQLVAISKGPTDRSETWSARYWVRQIALALRGGWRQLVGGNRVTV